jgi:nucleoside-diphosphate-sugar epimerase
MMDKKNLLIIGGSYFTGRVFVEEIIKTNEYNIFVYNRGNLPLNKPEVKELTGDRSDINRIKKVIPDNEWHALIDFCAYTPEDIEKMIISLPGTFKQYIFISTTTVYGETVDLPVVEDAPKLTKPQPELGEYADYGFDKWRAECKLREMCETREAAYTVLRPAIIYGKYNYAPRESYFFDLVRDNKPIVIPDKKLALFSFAWVTDVAKLIVKCIGNKKVFNREFNIAAEDLVSYERFIKVLESVTEKQLFTMTMSVDEINARNIPLPFPLDNHLVYSGLKLNRTLEYKHIPFEDGMRKTYSYYQWLQKRRRSHP